MSTKDRDLDAVSITEGHGDAVLAMCADWKRDVQDWAGLGWVLTTALLLKDRRRAF